ncbi:MAG: hypothetical protein WCO56_15205 [Verrucomicrobiota bacterium]
MNMRPSPIITSLVFAVSLATGAFAAEPAPKLVPGNTLTITFPEMPPTFYALYAKKDLKAQMTVLLPRNYDPARKHPLLVYLNGGDGGTGDTLGVARGISGQQDFVCVSMPLFKADKPWTPGFGYIMVEPDGKYMWPFFKTMLDKVEALVPNLDPAHRVLGGFSNGAHATAALIDGSDGEVSRLFSAFLFVEGGGKLKHYDWLKGKTVMMVSSNVKSKPRAQQILDAAIAAGAKGTFLCEDVGQHDFPVAAYQKVGAWLHNPAME